MEVVQIIPPENVQGMPQGYVFKRMLIPIIERPVPQTREEIQEVVRIVHLKVVKVILQERVSERRFLRSVEHVVA